MSQTNVANKLSSAANKIGARGWGILILAWMVFMLAYFANFAFGIMLPDMRAEFGFGLETSGWLSAIAWIGKGLLTIPVALFITKANPKYVLQGIFFVVGTGMLLQGIAVNTTMLFIGRLFVMSVASAILTVLVLFKIQYVPKERMANINGIEVFAGPAGQSLGTLAIPFLIAMFAGWRNVLIFMGVITLIIAFAWSFICEKTEEPEATTDKIQVLDPLKEALSKKNVLLLAFGWPGTSLTWISVYTFWPTYAVETLGLTINQAGLVLGILPIASALAALTAPFIAKKYGYDRPLICLSGFVLPFTYFALLQTSSIPLLCIASFLSGYAAYSFVPLAFTTLYRIPGISPKAISMGTGFIFSLVGLGGALGGVITGILGAKVGLYDAIAITCVAPFLFGILALFLDETGEKAQKAIQ